MTTDPTGNAPTTYQRLAAGVALVALLLALGYLVVEAVRRWGVLLLSAGALAVAVAALWGVLSRRGTARMLAALVLAAALVLFVVVVLASESLRVALVTLALASVAVVAAGQALGGRAPARVHGPGPKPSGAARQPVLIMNLRSGGGKAARFDLVERCRERGIEPVVLGPGDDVRVLAAEALARGADVIGMAGGDGSQSLVAELACRHGVPLVVVPAGTRNHFALDLGLDRDDVPAALEAYTDGVDVVTDLAEVNGRTFVNNVSMGVYAQVVQSSDYRDAKVRTAAAVLPDVLGPDADPPDLRFTLPSGAEATTAQLLLVSNNPYQLARLRGGGTRERLDGGVLGVVAVQVGGAADAERLAALEAVGRVGRFAGWHEWTTTGLVVRSGSPVEVGVDGEALLLQPPLTFTVRPGALTVRIPRSAYDRRQDRPPPPSGSAATLAALWRTVRGRAAVRR